MKCSSNLFRLFSGLIILFVPIVSAHAESESLYGPRFEFGPGVGLSLESEELPWTAKSYQLGLLTAAIRVFKGLSVQGGIEYGRGRKHESEIFPYGDYQLNINKKTYTSSYLAGVRYEFPMSMLKMDIMGIHSVYGAGGMCWTDYGVRSSEWTYKGIPGESEFATQYRTARLKGPYFMLAARWRMDSTATEGIGSWIGSYGVDFGVRYNTFGSSRMEYDIQPPPDSFTSFRVFIVGFVKFRLFE